MTRRLLACVSPVLAISSVHLPKALNAGRYRPRFTKVEAEPQEGPTAQSPRTGKGAGLPVGFVGPRACALSLPPRAAFQEGALQREGLRREQLIGSLSWERGEADFTSSQGGMRSASRCRAEVRGRLELLAAEDRQDWGRRHGSCGSQPHPPRLVPGQGKHASCLPEASPPGLHRLSPGI